MEAYKKIMETGDLSMSELEKGSAMEKVALNTMNYFCLGSCITTNIIDERGLLLPITMMNRDEVKNTQARTNK